MDILDIALYKKLCGGGSPTPPPTPAEIEPKDVNFIDYDGTVLYAYTTDELADLNELPPNTEHAGLVAQGWNFTLEELQENGLPCVVGQSYTTDDGATRFYVTVKENKTLNIKNISGTGEIDWGDGVTFNINSYGNPHSYEEPGKYVISIRPKSGKVTLSGNMFSLSKLEDDNVSMSATVDKIEIGENFQVTDSNAFSYLPNLEYITVSKNTPVFRAEMRFCCKLKSLTVFSNVDNLSIPTFTGCYSLGSYSCNATYSSSLYSGISTDCKNLKLFTIPYAAITVGENTFAYKYGISKVVVPPDVTNIRNYAFGNNRALLVVQFNSVTPPSLYSSSVFSGCSTSLKIYVPDGSEDAYKTATNWTSHASKIHPESDML